MADGAAAAALAAQEEAFATGVTDFHQQLLDGHLEDAFGSILTLANVSARIAQQADSGALPCGEMLRACEEKLAAAILNALRALVQSRQADDEAAKAKATADAQPRSPAGQRGGSAARREQGRRSGGKGKKELSAEERRAKLVEQTKRFKQREQTKLQEQQSRQERELLKQQERELQDRPRLQRAAELCRLVESLRLVRSEGCDGGEHSGQALGLFSELVCSGLDERYELVISELKAHRALATRTTGVAQQIEASDDDPYLKALAALLQFADGLIEKLMLGEYAVASSDSAMTKEAAQEASAVNALATSRIVQDVESKTSRAVVYVLEALYKDKRVEQWLAKVGTFRTQGTPLGEEDVAAVDTLLDELMEAQQYCGHFTRFLSSLGVLDPTAIASGGIASKQLDLASAYIQMEEVWVTISLRKAKALAGHSGEGAGCVNSLVEDTFFVVKKALSRAVYTESSHAASATANHIYRLLTDDYSATVLALLGGDVAPQLERSVSSEAENAEDLFAAALDSDLQGVGTLSSGLLVAVNTVELSAICMADLVATIREVYQERYPEHVMMVDMALQGLESTAELHNSLREKAITEIVEHCLRPALRLGVESGLRDVSYNLSHTLYEQYEREDPFVSIFLRDQLAASRNFIKCQANLTKSNFCVLLAQVGQVVAEAWEGELLQHHTFNELGALRLDQDLRAMQAGLRDAYYTAEERAQLELSGLVADQDEDEHTNAEFVYLQQLLRDHFSRLSQVAFLVGLEKASHVEQLPYSLPPVLTAEQVRHVLSRRVPPEPGVDLAALDVSSHCADAPASTPSTRFV